MAPSFFYIYPMATSFFYIYVMATSFFSIYVMAPSFFYIFAMATSFFYINLDIYIYIYKLTERPVVLSNALHLSLFRGDLHFCRRPHFLQHFPNHIFFLPTAPSGDGSIRLRTFRFRWTKQTCSKSVEGTL